MDVLHPVAPCHLVDAQRCRHRGIEAGGDATQGDAHKLITVTARHQGEALILGTRHQNQWSIQVDIREGHIPFSGESDDPVTGILEFLQGAVQVHDPRHGHVLKSPCRHLGGRTGESGTASLRQHHTVGSHGFSRTDDGAEVVGIGDPIKSEEQRRFTEIGTTVDQGVEIEGLRSGGLERDALMD